jgi:hypothetical protein
MHQAGEELLDALRARLGWRPIVTSFEAALAPWLWRALRPLIGNRVVSWGRHWYVGDPGRLLDAPWVVAMVAHEGTHALVHPLRFYPLYFLQQLLLLVAYIAALVATARGLLPAWVPFGVLGLLAWPWPAPSRATFEAEAYAVQVTAMRCFGMTRAAGIDQATAALAHPGYWMTPWPFKRALCRVYRAMVLRAMWDPRARLSGWRRDVQQVAQAWGYPGTDPGLEATHA